MDVLDEPLLQRHLLSVDQFHLMGEAGVLAPDARVELIEGEVIEMAPMGSRHFSAAARLNQLLSAAVGTRAIVGVQLPLRLGTRSEPQPDLCVLKPREDFYATALPEAADALLVVEVSDRTLAYDVRVKSRLYARHAIPEVWVFDLVTPLLRVFTHPQDGEYTQTREIPAPGPMALPGLDEGVVDLSEVLVLGRAVDPRPATSRR